MKVLVTGGTGFIGSHVVEALAEAGFSRIVLGRRASKHSDPNVVFALADIVDYEAVAEAVSKSNAVIHLAGLLGTEESLRKPEDFVNANVIGSINVFDACRHFNKPCVFTSVGNADEQSVYAISKSVAERLALMYNKEHNSRILIVRLFNTYGERKNPEQSRKLVPSTVAAALRNAPITIFGDGQQRNDYIYVKDVARILVKALKNERLDLQKVWHLGTGSSTSVLDTVNLIVRLAGSKSEIIISGRPRSGETISTVVADRAKLIDPHYQFTSLEAGLRSTIDYFRSHSASAEPALSLVTG